VFDEGIDHNDDDDDDDDDPVMSASFRTPQQQSRIPTSLGLGVGSGLHTVAAHAVPASSQSPPDDDNSPIMFPATASSPLDCACD
jgi:hypothetical protein